MSRATYDTVVVGGGVMGATVAFRLATAGHAVAILDKGGLCMQASGINAGTLSIQVKRAALIPYAIKGWEMWKTTRDWLGADVGFAQKGGITVAFTDDEAEMLRERMAARQAMGAPIEFISAARTRELEPSIAGGVGLASWCALDGYAYSNELGHAFRTALVRAGVKVCEFTAADGIVREEGGYVVRAGSDALSASRLVLASGVWSGRLLERDFGIRIPVACDVNQVTVTERMPPIVHRILGVATGLLSLKQSSNGTVLIGGGWQGHAAPDRTEQEIIVENLVGNLRLASFAIPALKSARVVRTWLGLEGTVADHMPIVGEVPGAPECYVIACVQGGYTLGPWMGTLLAERILGHVPAMPLFDPARVVRASASDRSSRVVH
jgi:glycine/D-amino acid oxidase-like deaminating enzyme